MFCGNEIQISIVFIHQSVNLNSPFLLSLLWSVAKCKWIQAKESICVISRLYGLHDWERWNQLNTRWYVCQYLLNHFARKWKFFGFQLSISSNYHSIWRTFRSMDQNDSVQSISHPDLNRDAMSSRIGWLWSVTIHRLSGSFFVRLLYVHQFLHWLPHHWLTDVLARLAIRDYGHIDQSDKTDHCFRHPTPHMLVRLCVCGTFDRAYVQVRLH